MKRRSAAIWLAGMIAAAAMLWLLARPAPKQWVRLADGSILGLEGVKLGKTNEFLEGNMPERNLRKLMPAKGIEIFRWHLQHADEVGFHNDLTTTMTLQFTLSGPGAKTNHLAGYSREFRAILAGDDGFEYFNELGYFGQHRDGLFGYLSTPIFPRDSRTLNIRIEHRDSLTAPWQTLAEFTHRQRPGVVKDKPPEPEPRLRNIAGVRIQLGEVTVRSGTFVKGDIWGQTVLIPWQVSKDGTPLTNWNAQDVVISDASGNADHFGAQKTVTNGWIIDRLWRSLDPQKVWTLGAGFAQDSDFAATNLYTVRLPYAKNETVETNLGGFPLRVGIDNRDLLLVQLLSTNRSDLRLSFVRAEDQLGREIADWSGSTGQFEFRRQLRPFEFWKQRAQPAVADTVAATFAIHQNIPVEFTIKPVLLPSSKTSGPAK